MSRQNKAARNRKAAQAFSSQRKLGGKGPSRTTPKHGKRMRQPGVTKREARENPPVAAVCGAEARVYMFGRLHQVYPFPHHGAALTFAVEFDARQKGAG